MSEIPDTEAIPRFAQPKRFGLLPEEGYVTEEVVRAFFGGISRTSLWRLLKIGAVPPADIAEGRLRLWAVEKLRAARVGKPGSRRKTAPK